MLPRTLLSRTLTRSLTSPAHLRLPLRCLSTQPEPPPKSWLTRKIESSPTTKNWFLNLTKIFGYGSPKQLAGRRAFVLYEHVAATTPDQDTAFWQKECHLPPTFQSWFTVTNLHIWLLTVRLRALPDGHGKYYIQALIDHFFTDIEDRIRAVLQPPARPIPPYTFISPFYVNPNAPKIDSSNSDPDPVARRKLISRAPDRIVNRQMKIFKEQWAGLGLSFDLALVKGDQEMAGAVWRNLLGARGARGITYPDSSDQPSYRRSVNLVGGEVVNVAKIDFDKEATRDDGSGVHDFPPSEVDKYVAYPELMLDIVGYVRRELVRLEQISDEDIMSGDWQKLKFGPVRNARS
ncbi:CBP3-like protein [Leucoagaricus sp. SymC.cos]|nr:CBP3-like protein [Leucoagaricus sp. SymC.cos]